MAGLIVGGLLLVGSSGCGNDDGGGAFPGGQKQPLATQPELPTSAEGLVDALYGALAHNDAATACGLFSPSGQAAFVEGAGMPTCEAAVDSIAQQVVDAEAFAHPTVEIDDPAATTLDEWCSTGIHVSTPEGALTDNGYLAAFAYTRQPDGTWQVTDYTTTSCGG
ncbi:MAG TPA: hypothetical protein VGO78_16670 [Acidimicrobiales bacterium]|nr:hypothetical protein [Acidimicrobiales bacterium]